MTDRISPAERSALMSRIRGRDTEPEIAVRKTAHAAGFRYGLYRRDLPGTPDLVFSSRNAIVLVHGCFWHGHQGCPAATVPKTRAAYWIDKIEANRRRDQRKERQLRSLGWRVMVVWQCQTKDRRRLQGRLTRFLSVVTQPARRSGRTIKFPRNPKQP